MISSTIGQIERKHCSRQCASLWTINIALSFGAEARAKSVIGATDLLPQATRSHFQSTKATKKVGVQLFASLPHLFGHFSPLMRLASTSAASYLTA